MIQKLLRFDTFGWVTEGLQACQKSVPRIFQFSVLENWRKKKEELANLDSPRKLPSKQRWHKPPDKYCMSF